MAYLSFLFLPILLVFPAIISADIYFDLSRQMLALNAKLYGVTIFKTTCRVSDEKLVCSINNDEFKELQIGNKKASIFKKFLPYLRYFKVKNVNVLYRFSTDDAYTTALLGATVNGILELFDKNKITVKSFVNYDNNTSAEISVKAQISVIRLLGGYIKNSFKERKYVGQ